MVRKELDYSNRKIYKISSEDTEMVYIGSTIKPLSSRLRKHKSDYNNWTKGVYHYVTSFDIVKFANCCIELVEEYPCSNRKQLERREGEVILETNNVINKRVEGRTYEEWYEQNFSEISKYHKDYYKLNKTEIVKKGKIYYEKNKAKLLKQQSQVISCECGINHTKNKKSRHKQSKRHQSFLDKKLFADFELIKKQKIEVDQTLDSIIYQKL